MSTLINMPSTVADIDVAVFDYSSLMGGVTVKNGNVVTTTWKKAGAGNVTPFELVLEVKDSAPSGPAVPTRQKFAAASRAITIRIYTWITETQPDDTIVRRPITGWIGCEFPTDIAVTKDHLRVVMSTLFALTFKSATSTVPENDAVLDALLQGVTGVNWS